MTNSPVITAPAKSSVTPIVKSNRLLPRIRPLLASVCLACTVAILAEAAPPPSPGPLPVPGPAAKTNPAGVARNARTNADPSTVVKPGGTTTAAAQKKASGTNTVTSSSFSQKLQKFRSGPLFLPVVVGGVVVLLGLLLLTRKKSASKAASAPQSIVSKAAAARAYKPQAAPATIHACNVLQTGTEERQVWQFEAKGKNFVLSREHTAIDGGVLPGKLVSKSWRSLFYRKLNIAWLPPENVFLRVIHLPRSDFAETLSMVELQLEKLSPMPVAQTVWSIHTLAHVEGNLQTVIVMIVSRTVVEEFLGKLEGQGFLADRLELPLLDQLQATAITEDGAYIYPEAAGGKNSALVAWWYGGVLQNLDLLTLPASAAERAAGVREQLTQMAWAGEMEGWLQGPPDWHLVADAVVASEWEPVLRQGLEQSVDVTTPLGIRELAALTARRSATADPRANLMPIEFALRYQQQFVDRLWMRGLLAVGAVYVAFVICYMIGLQFVSYKTTTLETEVAQLGHSYTNALQLKAKWQVLKDREELKFAALDCWKATAEHLPDSVTLESMNFSQGKHLRLSGTAPADAFGAVNQFEADMKRHQVNGQPFFDGSKGEGVDWRVQGSTAQWSLGLDLKREEAMQ